MSSAQSIRFKCDGCGFKIKVAAKHAGRKAKCPDCGNAVLVPQPKPARPSVGGAAAAVAASPPRSAKPAPPKDDSFDLDGFELDEPVGYDLNEDAGSAAEETKPEWMKHAHAADAQAASLPKLGHAATKVDRPSVGVMLFCDGWGLIALGTIVLFWVAYLVLVVTGYDLVALLDSASSNPGNTGSTAKGLLIVSLILTVLLGPVAVFRYRRTWLLYTRGVMVPCLIVKVGKFSKQELVDVTFQYTFNSKTYKPRMSVNRHLVDGITHLLVDPEKPSRCLVDKSPTE